MNFASYKAIQFRRDGKVLHATFNRPDTLNAFDHDLHTESERLFVEAATDDATSVVVITGAGRAFSAGGNIDDMQVLIDKPLKFMDGLLAGKRLINALLDCPKPVIAKVNGPAMGLGATVALFSDIIFAANHAKIADPHVKVGFVAGDGGSVIWPQLIGYARAKEYLLTGDPITGEEAARIGLINRAVPAEQLDQVTSDFAQKLAAGAGRAIQWTKISVNAGLKLQMAAVFDASFAYEMMSNFTQDHAEAVAAFRAKRPPNFTGD
jgi:enoyl-CoA hydratase